MENFLITMYGVFTLSNLKGKFRNSLWVCSIAAISFLIFGLPATARAGHGFYVVDKSVRSGMLVSLTNNPGVVEPATDKNAAALVGVIGNSATDLDVAPGQVAVQTDGVVQVLVSTLAGDIAVGDRISPSSIVGVGTRNNQAGWVVGMAQGSLSSSSAGAVKTSLKDANGTTHEVYIGHVDVLVKVAYFNPGSTSSAQAEASFVPKRIQAILDSAAGKRASVVAVVLASLLMLAGILITGYIINSTVRSGIESLARQPLAKHEIVRGMTQTLLLAVGVLISTLAGALVVLRLF